MQNKLKFKGINTFLIAGLGIGILLAWQFNSDILVSSNFPVDEIEARESLMKDMLDEQSYLQSRIVSLRKDIEEAQTEIEEQTKDTNLSLLDSLKKEIGLTEEKGAGLEVTLNDSPLAIREGADVNEKNLVQASDIRDVINILFASNAQAISVNKQRIIATSPITSVGKTILVNNAYIAPPFVISAIGDQEIMLQRLQTESLLPSIYTRSKSGNISFKITKKNTITIPIYNGDLKTKYLNLVE